MVNPKKIKNEFVKSKVGLETVNEYVAKMKNRIKFLAKEEQRMQFKNQRMSAMMQRREEVLLSKWEDELRTN